MKKKDINKRIKAYASLATVALAAGDADAQVVYTDISPDFTGGAGLQYFLDLNNDAVNDFRIYNSSSNLYIEPLTGSNDVLGTGGYTFAYPYALSLGATISSSAGSWNNNGYSSGFQSLNYGSGSYGNFANVTNKYVGLRFVDGAQTYYGWARLDVGISGNTWTVKDYAYDSTSAVIYAGIVPTDTARNITGTDVGELSDASDLEVSFDSAYAEEFITEYRIMVVKASAAGTFDTLAANAVPATNYTSIAPTGASNYTQTLDPGALDTDGDDITIGVPYQVFILSVNNVNNTNRNSLGSASATVTLNTTAGAALNITASDIAETGDGTDLQVDFNKAVNENTVSEYRIMVVKASNAGSFNAAAAAAVTPANYTSVPPAGTSNYSSVLSATATDTDGDAIGNGVPYRVFIYSPADGTNSNIDNLPQPTDEITLTDFTGIAGVSEAVVSMNYANGFLRIGELKHHGTSANLRLYNTAGQLVLEQQTRGNESVNVATLPAGAYVVNLSMGEYISTMKFIK